MKPAETIMVYKLNHSEFLHRLEIPEGKLESVYVSSSGTVEIKVMQR